MSITRRRFMSITHRGMIGMLTAIMLLAGSSAQAAGEAAKRIMVYGDSNTWGYSPSKAG